MYVPRRTKSVRRTRVLLFRSVFLLIIICLSLFYFLQSSFWSIQTIIVEGNHFLEETEVLELASMPLGLNIFKADVNQGEKNIILHPLVKNTKITREFPRTIRITVQERVPLVLVPYQDGFWQVDENRVILRYTSTITGISLPLVTGIELGEASPGEAISSPELARVLQLARELPLELKGSIGEINVLDSGMICLFTTQGIEVYLGDGERLEEKVQLLTQVMAQENLELERIKYIDLSFHGPAVIKYRD
jgi:cell division protein FtsQ